MDQLLELSIWLGIAGLALVAAQILLWHTRRVLGRSRQARVPGVNLAPAAVKVRLVAATVTESAGSAIAS